jgi:hypothetical protein
MKKSENKTVTVRAFIDPKAKNMGLEKYNLALFEETSQKEPIRQIIQHGKERFITGLNPFAPEILEMDEDERSVLEAEMREHVSYLEKTLNNNPVDVKDKEFWSKVELLHPSNTKFFSGIDLELENKPKGLQISKNPEHYLLWVLIKNGAFNFCAASYEDAEMAPRKPKFFLDEGAATISSKNEFEILKARASSKLLHMYENSKTKLLFITKVLDHNGSSYRYSTDKELLYQEMNNYLKAESVSASVRQKANERFLKMADLRIEDLKMKALIKDALFFRFIEEKPDRTYATKEGVGLGRTLLDIESFLLQGKNEDIKNLLIEKVEEQWNVA